MVSMQRSENTSTIQQRPTPTPSVPKSPFLARRCAFAPSRIPRVLPFPPQCANLRLFARACRRSTPIGPERLNPPSPVWPNDPTACCVIHVVTVQLQRSQEGRLRYRVFVVLFLPFPCQSNSPEKRERWPHGPQNKGSRDCCPLGGRGGT